MGLVQVGMDREQYALVKRIFIRASGLSEEERADFLDEACRDDPELRAEVESLLRYDRPENR